jgi:hypothetical protein
MPILPIVPNKKIALSASWFKSVRDRIEENKSLEGNYIILIQTSDGNIINVDYDRLKDNLATDLGGDGLLAEYTLNVCKNGVPATLIVYGPAGQET